MINQDSRRKMKNLKNKMGKGGKKKRRKSRGENWSAYVTGHSSALDLEEGVFTFKDPRRIALSLKKSAEESKRRKAGPFQSAMSMLNFYINRAGRKLKKEQAQILEEAKKELRRVFGREK